jgi:hypothetical protein
MAFFAMRTNEGVAVQGTAIPMSNFGQCRMAAKSIIA